MGISYGARNAAAWTPKNTSVSSSGFVPPPLLPDRSCPCGPSLWTQRGRRAGVAQGPLLTSPGADLPRAHPADLPSAGSVSALPQETPPPGIWLITGKVRRDGFKAGHASERGWNQSCGWGTANTTQQVLEVGTTELPGLRETAAPELLFRHGMVAHHEGPLQSPKSTIPAPSPWI